jgi:hypothetical protein
MNPIDIIGALARDGRRDSGPMITINAKHTADASSLIVV